MSGHSKWSKVKHQKATTDAIKASAFTRASRAITIAVRDGGGVTDPACNFRLRLAIEKAKEVNMPKENIKRAIDKAGGEGGVTLLTETYEAYGPHGVALLIETATDNRQRTVSSIKQVLDFAGGSMSAPGAVSYLFTRTGLCVVAKQSCSFDAVFTYALDAGATDVVDTGDVYEVFCEPQHLFQIKDALTNHGVLIETSEIIMKPTLLIDVPPDAASSIDSLVERLESLDDVQAVYTTYRG